MNKELKTELTQLFKQSKVATYADLEQNMDFFLKLMKEVRIQLESKIKEGDDSKEEKISSLANILYKSENNIKKLLTDVQNQNKADLNNLFNKFKLEIDRLEESIPEIPEIEEVDTSDIEKKLDETCLRIDFLEKENKNNDEYNKLEETFNKSIEELNTKIDSFKKDLNNRYSGNPIFGRMSLKVLDNGTEISGTVTELNFTNATSITTTGVSKRRVNIETGGSGGSTGAATPIAPTSGAINSSNTAFVFATEPKVIVANGVAIRQGYGFTWDSGTSTATLDNAPSTGTDVFGYSPVTTTGRDPGVLTVSDATSITPSTASYRIIHQTNTQSAGTLTINADSDTPVDGRAFTLRIDSANIQTFSWNSQYVGGTIALPTATSGSGKVDYYSFIYYGADSKYHFIGSALNLG